MKIPEMIKNLQELMTKYGDLDCWYAIDGDESGYQEVSSAPSLKYIDSAATIYTSVAYINEEDFKENETGVDKAKPICIVN